MKMCFLLFHLFLLAFAYAFYILITDVLIGEPSFPRYRIIKIEEKYRIQCRDILSPFWITMGMGDICGFSFSAFEFDDIETARNEIRNLENKEKHRIIEKHHINTHNSKMIYTQREEFTQDMSQPKGRKVIPFKPRNEQ